MSTIDNGIRDQYEEEGYVVVPEALSLQDLTPLIDQVRRTVDRKSNELLSMGKIENIYKNSSFESRWYEVCRQLGPEQEFFGWHEDVFGRSHMILL